MTDHHPECPTQASDYRTFPGGYFADGCTCGPCEKCDDDGMVERYMGADAGGYSYHDVPMVCPTCDGTKIDPEANY